MNLIKKLKLKNLQRYTSGGHTEDFKRYTSSYPERLGGHVLPNLRLRGLFFCLKGKQEMVKAGAGARVP